MTAGISSLRIVPINGPGGGGVTLGDASRPSYQVLVTDEETINARNKFMESCVEKRLHPIASRSLVVYESASSGREEIEDGGLTLGKTG
jgi:hypothetical protein